MNTDLVTVAQDFIVKQNATLHFASVPSSLEVNSDVLQFTIYLNTSIYETSESLTLQLEDDGPFTSFFNLSSGTTSEVFFFNNTSNTARRSEQVSVSSGIVYVNRAPAGEYETLLIATVRSRAQVGVLQTETTDNATITISITEREL